MRGTLISMDRREIKIWYSLLSHRICADRQVRGGRGIRRQRVAGQIRANTKIGGWGSDIQLFEMCFSDNYSCLPTRSRIST